MKKIRLAIIGPSDSVALIEGLAHNAAYALETIPIVYQDASEVPAIIDSYYEKTDTWLFSGIVPYTYAKQNPRASQKPMYYITHTGSSLYRVLVQMAYHEGSPIRSISFDTFSRAEIEESFLDLSNQHIPNFYLYEYHDAASASTDKITNFHYQLWKDKKIDVAVTCFYSSYLSLKKLGVPAFRIWPTRNEVRAILRLSSIDAQASHFKSSQISIQHIAIADYANFIRDAASDYAAKRIELKLYELLLAYTEKIQGSIINHTNGQFTIYSTRGILEKITNAFTILPLLDDLTRNFTLKIDGGIGFGTTAHTADENAHIALDIAQHAGHNRWMVVLDNKTIMGPLSSSSHLEYDIHSDDTATHAMAEKLNVSVTTINRLLAALNKIDQTSVDAASLAFYLGITPRSTRRLLSSMVKNKYAVECGEEGFGKGRPHKLYTINIERLIR